MDLSPREKGNVKDTNVKIVEGQFSMTEVLDFIDNANKEIVNEMTLEELTKILSSTIKGDDLTKQVLFLISLLTFTEQEQKNIILTGESSRGKTHNITEVTWYYPETSILRFEGATPKSFIHKKEAIMIDVRTGKEIRYTDKPSKEKKSSDKEWEEWQDIQRHAAYKLNYANKIIIFPDMPDTRLLKNLRPLLSHDHKVCRYDVTEKKESGLRTKEVLIEGFFTSIFASANTDIDEQEASRHYLLSPSDDSIKQKASIELTSRQNSDPEYENWRNNDPERVRLKARVDHIAAQGVKKIFIPEGLITNLEAWFIESVNAYARPKAQRDYPRLIALAKAWALLNISTRKYEDETLWCNETDIEVAKQIYEPIIKCNELGLTPEEFGIWNMIEPKIATGLTMEDFHETFAIIKKRSISDSRLRGIIRNFQRAGLLKSKKEGTKLIYSSINGNGANGHKEDMANGQVTLEQKIDNSLRGKMEFVRDLFQPNMDMSIEDVASQVGDKIKPDEVQKIIYNLSSEGTITEYQSGKYRLVRV